MTRKYLAEGENAYSADDEVVAPPVVEPVKPSVDDVTGGAEEVDEYGIATTEELEENIEHAIAVPMSDVTVSSGSNYGVDIPNYPLNSIIIKKSDAITKEMLQGATFEVIKTSGETSGTNGTVIMTVTTDISGVIVITGLEAGTYAIKEIDPPTNYLIAETNLQTVTLKADGTSIVEVLFNNYPYGSLLINKVDSKTNDPMQDA